MIELKGDDYILYIKGLDNEKLLYEMIKQAVIFNGLAQQEQVTDDDIRVLLDSFFNDSKKVEFGTVMSSV